MADLHATTGIGQGAVDITIEGPGLFTIADNYFVCRYRPVTATNLPCGTGWSDWTGNGTATVLDWRRAGSAGGGQINPFTQRVEGGGLEGAETRFGV